MIKMKYFVLTYTGKPIGESGENCGTKYDLNFACDVCGTGARIVWNLRTNKLNKTSKAIFQTVDGDFIISENLYNMIININIQIGKLKKVVDKKGNYLPLYHLYSEINLPKSLETNGLIVENQCLGCKRNGYFNDVIIGDLNLGVQTVVRPVVLIYDKPSVAELADSEIFNSWEHMGLSNKEAKGNLVVRFARPLMIVSEKLKQIIENSRPEEFKFEPIRII